ncbi:MAG: two component transcriptional regulator, sensor histidine kinase [Variovorax sp.]|nr:two component transcriptional regulator, sensor histidine kinase [Variovorax sp.]
MTQGGTAQTPRTPSLSRRVLRNVLLPLALAWTLGAAIALGVAYYFSEQAFDRAMLNDAYALAANVRSAERDIEFMLNPRGVATTLFDRVETVYFAVLRPDGTLISGHGGLHAPLPEPGANKPHRFSDIVYQGKALRAVALRHEEPSPYFVVVAQTTRGRTEPVRRLLGYAFLPQIGLLLLLAVWLWRGVRHDLRPLGALQEALDRRDGRDLAPVPVVRGSREVERLGDAVNALLERLGHSARAQREFAGNVAHELRTPLAGIRALADYGLAHADPAVWRDQLERIAASQARASHLIDQLLGLALADEVDTALQRAPVRLDELAEQAVLRHLARADALGVDLGARGLEASVTVRANAALVEGILDNLIDNALRYGGRTITVELAGRTLGVVDDGPGIPGEARCDLMRRWSQGAAGQKLGQGTGLGLAIVARYAQLLGARLTLEAATPSGLRVGVAFEG